MKSPPPENHFPVPRGAGASKGDITSPREIISPFRSRVVRASKGDIASPREIISPFRSRVVRASKDDIATPFPPKRPKSPTGHPGALGKVPQSIPQWMFSESISDAFHPGDFPISPRLTRGRSAAAGLRTTSGLRVVRARRKMKSPPPEKMWSARRKVKSPPPENHFPVPRGAAQRPEKIRGPRVER